MFSRPRPHDVNVSAHGVTRILNGHNPQNSVFERHHAAGESEKLVHGTRATNEDGGDYFDESGWRRRLDSGDMDLIPREIERVSIIGPVSGALAAFGVYLAVVYMMVVG